MNTSYRDPRRVPALVVAIIGLLAAMAPAAHANSGADAEWAAWGLAVDFPGGQPHVVYTAYVGRNNPDPEVLAASEKDISLDCKPEGNLSYAYDASAARYEAVFDGQSYLACKTPDWRELVGQMGAGHLAVANQTACECEPGHVPFFVAADVKLDQQPSSSNPVVDARALGLIFSLPITGNVAQTKLALSSQTHTSPTWIVDSTGEGNRVLLGQYGEGIVNVATRFGWLDFLTDTNDTTGRYWADYFNKYVKDTYVGHWVELPGTFGRITSRSDNYTLNTESAEVFIGYNKNADTYLHGRLAELIVDPGCQGT